MKWVISLHFYAFSNVIISRLNQTYLKIVMKAIIGKVYSKVDVPLKSRYKTHW